MATSFINEHTAEFYIVPYLKNELEKYFAYVAPIFPWLNRETSGISKLLHGADRFRVHIVFPRRPKLNISNINKIYITINRELLEFKEFAKQYDTSVILGCPVAANFWELSKCSKYVWLELDDQQPEKYLNPIQSEDSNEILLPSISVKDIVKHINNSAVMDINLFFEFIREARYILPSRFIFGARYKPVYFLINDTNNLLQVTA